jgi:hypothetical protein
MTPFSRTSSNTNDNTNSVAKKLYDKIAASGDDLRSNGVLTNRLDIVTLGIVVSSLIIAIHNGSQNTWPWAVIATAAILIVLYERSDLNNEGSQRVQATSTAVQDIYDHAEKNTVGISPDDDTVLHPHLYSMSRLKGRQSWLRGDPNLVAALNTLRPFNKHDSHRVRLILELLGEFYRRYHRLLNRSHTLHIHHQYTILHDLHLRVLNTIHELYFTKPLVLCTNLEIVIRTVQARTYRMLRVIRHKYPDVLRAVKIEKGSAPRSFDASWTSYDLFV